MTPASSRARRRYRVAGPEPVSNVERAENGSLGLAAMGRFVGWGWGVRGGRAGRGRAGSAGSVAERWGRGEGLPAESVVRSCTRRGETCGFRPCGDGFEKIWNPHSTGGRIVVYRSLVSGTCADTITNHLESLQRLFPPPRPTLPEPLPDPWFPQSRVLFFAQSRGPQRVVTDLVGKAENTC